MRLAPDGSEVRISIPNWGRTAEALQFAASRQTWLAQQLTTLPPRITIEPGAMIPHRGRQYRLQHDPAASRRPTIADSAIVMGGPIPAIEQRLRRWLEDEARSALAVDLDFYCQRAGRPTPPMALSHARKRWGSCAVNGTIRINWRLIMAPDFVRRSVVAHEVAHLAHFDHSAAFHAHLAQVYEGEVAAEDQWLKREGRSLYAQFGYQTGGRWH